MKTVEMDARTWPISGSPVPMARVMMPSVAACTSGPLRAGWRAGSGSSSTTTTRVTPPAQCRTDIGITVPQTRGEGEVETQLIPAGRYAQSRYLITDRNQYGPRWQEHG